MSGIKVILTYYNRDDPETLEVNYPHLKKDNLKKYGMKSVIADLLIEEMKDIEYIQRIEIFPDIMEEDEEPMSFNPEQE